MNNQKKAAAAATNAITEGIIWRQLLIFFFPIVLGTFFQQLYNTADAMIVGRFVGKEALAAVGGSSNQIINLIIGFFVGVSSGATVIIAQHYGSRKETELSHALHTAIAFSTVSSIFLMGAGYFLAPALLSMMNTPESMMADSVTYLRIFFLGILFTFIYNIGSSILRSVGDSKRPLYYLIVCCFLNHRTGSSICSRVPYGNCRCCHCNSTVSGSQCHPCTARPDTDIRYLQTTSEKSPLLRRLPVLDPSYRNSCRTSSSHVQLVEYHYPDCSKCLGTDTVAAWTSFGKMDAFCWMVISAFGISATTFVGQNYGAGKYDRVRKSVRVCLGMTLASSIAMSIFLMTAGKYLFHLFTSDPEVIRIGIQILNYMAPAYALFVFIEIYSGALRGIGDVIIPTIMTCCGVCVFRTLWVFLLVPKSPTIETITLSYPISWGITAVLFIIYYYKKQKKLGMENFDQ